MAVAYGSVNSATLAGAGGSGILSITKPTSLASGDMMVAVCGIHGQPADFTPEAGWATLFTANDGNNYGIRAFWKIANSTDAAATDFDFTIVNTSGDGIVGWLVRITGSLFIGIGNFTFTSDVNNSGATSHTFTPGVTPPSATALYLMGAYARGLTTESGYAITNNNPTWTERVDTNINTTRDSTLSLATAVATSINPTGDFSLTLANSLEAIGFLIAIEESTNVTVSPGVQSVVVSVQDPTVTGGATASPAVIAVNVNIQAPTVITPAAKWLNPDKNNSSWDNLSKS